jgi:hypothetical protein
MAENTEKTEAELLEEAMQNLGLEEVIEEKKSGDLLVEGSSSLTDEEIESLIRDDEPEDVKKDTEENKKDESQKNENEKKELIDEISPVDDINLNNSTPIEDDTDLKLNDDQDVQKKKNNKFVKILTIIISILLSLVSIGAVLYLIGFFDPKPVKKVIVNDVKPKKEEYQFKAKDIDENRLNKKLNLLTKYEIVENPTTEAKKSQEKEKLYLEAKKQLEMERLAQIEKIKDAERKRMQDALPIVQKENIDQNIDKEIDKQITNDDTVSTNKNTNDTKTDTSNNTNTQETKTTDNNSMSIDKKDETTKKEDAPSSNNSITTTVPEAKPVDKTTSPVPVASDTIPAQILPIVEEKPKVSQFVKVIKIATKNKDIYKSYLDKIYSVNDNVTLCRDYQNNVEIFIGPFENDVEREKVAQEYLLKYNINVEIYDYTRDEYDKRCNY